MQTHSFIPSMVSMVNVADGGSISTFRPGGMLPAEREAVNVLGSVSSSSNVGMEMASER